MHRQASTPYRSSSLHCLECARVCRYRRCCMVRMTMARSALTGLRTPISVLRRPFNGRQRPGGYGTRRCGFAAVFHIQDLALTRANESWHWKNPRCLVCARQDGSTMYLTRLCSTLSCAWQGKASERLLLVLSQPRICRKHFFVCVPQFFLMTFLLRHVLWRLARERTRERERERKRERKKGRQRQMSAQAARTRPRMQLHTFPFLSKK
jgi:hypothetical protein